MSLTVIPFLSDPPVPQSDAELQDAFRECLVEIEPANILKAIDNEIAIAREFIRKAKI